MQDFAMWQAAVHSTAVCLVHNGIKKMKTEHCVMILLSPCNLDRSNFKQFLFCFPILPAYYRNTPVCRVWYAHAWDKQQNERKEQWKRTSALHAQDLIEIGKLAPTHNDAHASCIVWPIVMLISLSFSQSARKCIGWNLHVFQPGISSRSDWLKDILCRLGNTI